VHVEAKRETSLTRLLASYESAYSDGRERRDHEQSAADELLRLLRDHADSLVAPIVELYRDRVRTSTCAPRSPRRGLRPDQAAARRARRARRRGLPAHRVHGDRAGRAENGRRRALLFKTTLELDITPDVDWDTSYQLVAVVTDFDRTSHHLSSTFSFEVWGPLDLDVSFIWDRIEEPAEDPNGDQPDSDDLQLTVGVSLEF
jgi:hypothetical protein